jgi:NitT/TauT family transport system permease protein
MSKQYLLKKSHLALSICSFLIPLLVWCSISYIPQLWHPQVLIRDPGSVSFFQAGSRVEKTIFYQQLQLAQQQQRALPEGQLANPIYLPAPDAVAKAVLRAFSSAPAVHNNQPWLPQSLLQSIQLVLSAFLLSSLVGVPLGILCGFSTIIARLTEPFVEFFRYLPAPAFGALAVAILGINDAPKIAIIIIGTLFTQILIIANTTRLVDRSLIEAGQTLGTNALTSLCCVVIPAALPDIYRDQRILLGCAWTYLIVSELIGQTSGITWFITQQARYQHFDQVYAAIIIIGVVGLCCDVLLMKLGQYLFKWKPRS